MRAIVAEADNLISRNALASGLESRWSLEPDASAFRLMGRATNLSRDVSKLVREPRH